MEPIRTTGPVSIGADNAQCVSRSTAFGAGPISLTRGQPCTNLRRGERDQIRLDDVSPQVPWLEAVAEAMNALHGEKSISSSGPDRLSPGRKKVNSSVNSSSCS